MPNLPNKLSLSLSKVLSWGGWAQEANKVMQGKGGIPPRPGSLYKVPKRFYNASKRLYKASKRLYKDIEY